MNGIWTTLPTRSLCRCYETHFGNAFPLEQVGIQVSLLPQPLGQMPHMPSAPFAGLRHIGIYKYSWHLPSGQGLVTLPVLPCSLVHVHLSMPTRPVHRKTLLAQARTTQYWRKNNVCQAARCLFCNRKDLGSSTRLCCDNKSHYRYHSGKKCKVVWAYHQAFNAPELQKNPWRPSLAPEGAVLYYLLPIRTWVHESYAQIGKARNMSKDGKKAYHLRGKSREHPSYQNNN